MNPFVASTRGVAAIGAVLLFAAMGACTSQDAVVQRGLLCDECRADLQRVVDLGDRAVEPLRVALREGPSTAARNNFSAQATEEYRLAKRAKDKGVGGTSTLSDSGPFVDRALGNLVASYQKRAAWALRAIGTPLARSVLHQANVDEGNGLFSWRADVRDLVRLIDDDDAITSVTVRSPAGSLPIGGTAQLTAEVRGVVQVAQAVTWASSNAAVGTVSAGGLLTRVSAGSVTVSACSTVNQSVCGRVAVRMP